MKRPIDLLTEIIDLLGEAERLKSVVSGYSYSEGGDPRWSDAMEEEADDLEDQANDLLKELLRRE